MRHHNQQQQRQAARPQSVSAATAATSPTTTTTTINNNKDINEAPLDPIAAAIPAAAANPLAAAGVWVRLVTSVGRSPIVGQIFAYDPDAAVVLVQGIAELTDTPTSSNPPPEDAASSSQNGIPISRSPSASATSAVSLHMVRLAAISSVDVASTSTSPSTTSTSSTTSSKTKTAPESGKGAKGSTADAKKAPVRGSSSNGRPPLVQPNHMPALIPLAQFHPTVLANKELQASRAEAERNSKIGVGVSKDAQTIFDALAKTLPANWRDHSMVVMDEIVIDPPYTSTSCRVETGKHGLDATLARVRKVLVGERRKLGFTE